ncbi:hypothetical protein DBR06_SOUSAS3310138, partial [Sousa chinensis]
PAAAGPGSPSGRTSWDGRSHTETSKSCRRRAAPARSRRPRPLLSADRKTDKKGSRPVVPCMFRVCHVWSRTGRGWRAGLRGRRRRGAGRIPAPPAGTCSRPPPGGDEVRWGSNCKHWATAPRCRRCRFSLYSPPVAEAWERAGGAQRRGDLDSGRNGDFSSPTWRHPRQATR